MFIITPFLQTMATVSMSKYPKVEKWHISVAQWLEHSACDQWVVSPIPTRGVLFFTSETLDWFKNNPVPVESGCCCPRMAGVRVLTFTNKNIDIAAGSITDYELERTHFHSSAIRALGI